MDLLREIWAIAMAGVGAIAWIIRLEARSNTNSKELIRLESRLAAQRAEDLANRQRDWDQMTSRLDTIQTDVKELLQRTSS